MFVLCVRTAGTQTVTLMGRGATPLTGTRSGSTVTSQNVVRQQLDEMLWQCLQLLSSSTVEVPANVAGV